MRCALIEFNAYHEETLPTFVRLLNELGIEPDVYMVRRSRERDPFALAPDLRFTQRRAERIDLLFGVPFRLRRYDLLIIGSMEPPANVDRVAATTTPMLGVMHNTELLSTDPTYQAFFSRSGRKPLVLGRHIARHLAAGGVEPSWIAHVYFGNPPVPRHGGTTIFTVSGNVEFNRRNYDSLLDAVSALAGERAPVEVRIVGRSTNRDGTAFRAEVERRGLSGVVQFSPGEITHREFFGLIAGSDFVLPLIDRTEGPWAAYFETKLASSIPFAIGLGTPLLLHEDLAATYGVTDCGLTYRDGELEATMRRAIDASEADRARWRASLHAVQATLLDASRENLREAMAAILP